MTSYICNIFNLNEDCIRRIFLYLAHDEILKFVSAIPQLYTIYEDYLKRERILPLDDFVKDYPSHLIIHTLSRIGPLLKEVTFDAITIKNTDYHLKLILEHCKQIELLEINYLPVFDYALWNKLLRALKLLKIFIVTFSPITDKIVRLLTFTKIEELTITRGDISGKYLNKLKKVTALNLELCEHLASNNVKAMFRSLKLQSLNILETNDLDESVFTTLAATQHRLRVLRMSSNYFGAYLGMLGRLPSLKELYIFDDGTESKCYELFEELTNCENPKLECLEVSNMWITESGLTNDLICKLVNLKRLGLIYDRYVDDELLRNISNTLKHLAVFLCPAACDITNEGVLEMIRNITPLNLLDLSHCTKLTTELIIEVIKILKEKKNSPVPFLMYLMGTNIDEDIVECEEYKSNKKLLTLFFSDYWTYGSPRDLYDLDDDY